MRTLFLLMALVAMFFAGAAGKDALCQSYSTMQGWWEQGIERVEDFDADDLPGVESIKKFFEARVLDGSPLAAQVAWAGGPRGGKPACALPPVPFGMEKEGHEAGASAFDADWRDASQRAWLEHKAGNVERVAPTGDAQAGGAPLVVEAEGAGAVIGGDTLLARDSALAAARLDALRQAVGVRLGRRSLIARGVGVWSENFTDVRGAVIDEQVLGERLGNDGVYHVRLRCKVIGDKAARRLRSLFKEDRILVALDSDEPDGRRHAARALAAKLEKALVAKGYQHVVIDDLGQVESLQGEDYGALVEAALRHHADIVVAGGVSLHGLRDYSMFLGPGAVVAEGGGWLNAYRVVEGRTLAAASVQDFQCFAQGELAAGKEVRAGVAEDLLAQLLAGITPRNEREIEVRVEKVADYASLMRFRRLVEEMRFVHGVHIVEYCGPRHEALLKVCYGESVNLFATQLQGAGIGLISCISKDVVVFVWRDV